MSLTIRRRRRGAGLLIALVAMMLMAASTTQIGYDDAEAQVPPWSYPVDSILDSTLLAKAQPDECFSTVGEYPLVYPDENGECPEGYQLKVNEAYVWGLAKSVDSLWFDTASNVLCGVLYGYLEVAEPVLTADYVCERAVYDTVPEPDVLLRTDTRRPNIYQYDLGSRTLVNWTSPEALADPAWTAADKTRLAATSGFRSAGALDSEDGNVVMLAGPGSGAINAFAFRTDVDPPQFIGSTTLTKYSNIRKWTVVDGALYTGVGVKTSLGGGGRILRWTGTLESPMQFTEVGVTGSEIAELTEHEGRIFGASWPGGGASAGIYMGPVVPEGGYTAAHATADQWVKVWSATDYEPDPVTATTYGGGALASFDGYLYWGTMHVPGRAALQHENVYGDPATPEEAQETFLNTLRAISIFRGRDFGTPAEQQQVVYGESELMVWNPTGGPDLLGGWESQPNGMGTPVWGESGFGNPFNNYTWTMEVYEGRLFISTMDWGFLAFGVEQLPAPEVAGLQALADEPALTQELEAMVETQWYSFGADVFRIDSSGAPGVFENIDGMGNETNYGMRTSVVTDALYYGSANPMNLMTDLTDDKEEGGWELIRARMQHQLLLAPADATSVVGGSHAVTATVSPARAGLEVGFAVTGANSATGTVATDADGKAVFTYTGANVGVDAIVASVDVAGRGWIEDRYTATAAMTWTPAPTTSTTTTTTLPPAGGGGGGGGGGTTTTTAPPVAGASRIEGANRYMTAAQTSARFFADGADVAFVVTGEGFADALATGPAAKAVGAPVLLTMRDELPDATAAELARLQPEEIVVVGGTAAVSEAVAAALEDFAASVVRLAGPDRYATSAVLAARYFAERESSVYLASGELFADALGAGAAAAHDGVPLLLTPRAAVPSIVLAQLDRLGPAAVHVVGGTAVVDDAVLDEVRALLADVPDLNVMRIAGADRFETSALLTEHAFRVPTGTVFVATGRTFPDALAASALGHPILLVERLSLLDAVVDEIHRLDTEAMVVLGGEEAVSEAVWDELTAG